MRSRNKGSKIQKPLIFLCVIFVFSKFDFHNLFIKRQQMSKLDCCLLGHPENKSSTWVVYLLLPPLLFLSFLNYAPLRPWLVVVIVVAAAFVVYAFRAVCSRVFVCVYEYAICVFACLYYYFVKANKIKQTREWTRTLSLSPTLSLSSPPALSLALSLGLCVQLKNVNKLIIIQSNE